jgi:hypothetical protein
MPNGKGSLECCYCVHWQGEYQGYDGAYEEGFCGFHQTTLPSTESTWTHRICSKFEPNTFFVKDTRDISLAMRFGWFGIKLEDGVLYGFSYNQPDKIQKIKNLSEQAS